MKLRALSAAAAAALALSASDTATAATVVIDFDTLTNNAAVNQFYNGGVDSLGLAGIDFGIEFINFKAGTAAASVSAPNYGYLPAALGKINVAAGFTGFDFSYGTLAPTTVSVYSGLNGTGTLLGQMVVNGNAGLFAQGALAFSGVAHSVTLAGTPNLAAVDNLRFVMALPVPEPGTLGLMLAGFGVLGLFGRRRLT
ncbi:MAG: PEP-CTERM sorting domain-containing protein [Pseudomonadota bacterium]